MEPTFKPPLVSRSPQAPPTAHSLRTSSQAAYLPNLESPSSRGLHSWGWSSKDYAPSYYVLVIPAHLALSSALDADTGDGLVGTGSVSLQRRTTILYAPQCNYILTAARASVSVPGGPRRGQRSSGFGEVLEDGAAPPPPPAQPSRPAAETSSRGVCARGKLSARPATHRAPHRRPKPKPRAPRPADAQRSRR